MLRRYDISGGISLSTVADFDIYNNIKYLDIFKLKIDKIKKVSFCLQIKPK